MSDREQIWQRKFVGFVERHNQTAGYDHLSVKIPRPITEQIERECLATGTHPMTYIANCFAIALRDGLTQLSLKVVLAEARDRIVTETADAIAKERGLSTDRH